MQHPNLDALTPQLDRGIYRWRFVRGDEEVAIACNGPLIVNSEPLMRRAALDGVGVAMLAEDDVADDIAAGRLVRVVEDWCPPMFGFFLYHPSHRLPSASLAAVIGALRMERTDVVHETTGRIIAVAGSADNARASHHATKIRQSQG